MESVASKVGLIVHREACRHGWDSVQRIRRSTAVIAVAARRALLARLARAHHVRESWPTHVVSRTPVESKESASCSGPVRGKRSAGLRSDYTQNVAILALGALQARLNELESAVIPQNKNKKSR